MVSNSPIPPGAEVFNTYGEHLTNAQLLARYGFALDDNDNDVVTFKLDDLSVPPNITNCWPCADRAALDALYGEVLRAWPRHNWDNSEIVYQPEVGPLSAEMGSTPSGGRLASARDARTLAVNSDGKISHGLWVYCTLCSMSCVAPIAGNTGAPHAVTVAAAGRRLAELQVHREMQGVDRPHEEATADDDGGDGDLPQLVGSTDKVRLQYCMLLYLLRFVNLPWSFQGLLRDGRSHGRARPLLFREPGSTNALRGFLHMEISLCRARGANLGGHVRSACRWAPAHPGTTSVPPARHAPVRFEQCVAPVPACARAIRRGKAVVYWLLPLRGAVQCVRVRLPPPSRSLGLMDEL